MVPSRTHQIGTFEPISPPEPLSLIDAVEPRAGRVVLREDSPLLHAPNLMLLSIDIEFRITEVLGNTEAFGLTREQAIGRSVLDFVAADQVERIISSYLVLASTKAMDPGKWEMNRWLTFNINALSATGEEMPASVSIHPVGDDMVVMIRVEPTPHLRHESLRRLTESTSLAEQLEAAAELISPPDWHTGFVAFPPAGLVMCSPTLPHQLVEEAVWRPVLESGAECIMVERLADPYRAIAEEHELRTLWVHPLHRLDRGRAFGVMVNYTEFEGDVILAGMDRVVEEARWVATLAMFQHDTVHRLEYLAANDHLTGVHNRSGLERHLRERGEDEVSVLYLDLDRFKEVNDRHGHAAGDAVLVEVATRLQAIVGDRGLVARLGGDEFCVIVEGGGGADGLVEEIIDGFAVPVSAAGGQGVGVSIGTSRSGRASEAWRLLREADEEMLQRKAGRAGGILRRADMS